MTQQYARDGYPTTNHLRAARVLRVSFCRAREGERVLAVERLGGLVDDEIRHLDRPEGRDLPAARRARNPGRARLRHRLERSVEGALVIRECDVDAVGAFPRGVRLDRVVR